MRYFGLSVGLEQEQTVAEQNEDKVAEVLDVDGVDNLETELLEVADSDAEGSAREEAIDEASEVIDSMEDDVEDLKTAQESGGIDQFAASILVRGVNHRLASIGMSPVMLPAQESFGSVSDRQAATAIAMEAISDKVREAWKAIINAIKRAAKWIKGHFVKVFGGFERLKKRAAAVAEKAEKATGNAKEKNFENDSLYNKLKVNNAVNANAGFFTATFETIDSVLKETSSVSGDLKSLVESLENYEDGKDDQMTGAIDSMMSRYRNIAGNTNVAKENQLDGSENMQSDELLGGYVIVKSAPAASAQEKRPAQYRLNLAPKDPKARKIEGRRLTVLSLSDASQIASRIEQTADEGIAQRKALDNLAEHKEKLAAITERLANKKDFNDADGEYDSSKESAHRTNMRGLRADIMAIDRLVGSFQGKLTSYTLSVAKSVLDYCELSIRQYSQD